MKYMWMGIDGEEKERKRDRGGGKWCNQHIRN